MFRRYKDIKDEAALVGEMFNVCVSGRDCDVVMGLINDERFVANTHLTQDACL